MYYLIKLPIKHITENITNYVTKYNAIYSLFKYLLFTSICFQYMEGVPTSNAKCIE